MCNKTKEALWHTILGKYIVVFDLLINVEANLKKDISEKVCLQLAVIISLLYILNSKLLHTPRWTSCSAAVTTSNFQEIFLNVN